MDRINLKNGALASIALAAVILFSACPLADPLELRDVIEERVAAAGTPGTPQDLQAPTGSVAISGGSAYIKSTSTALTITAADVGGGNVSQMLIGNESTFSGMSWEPYATSRVWSVPAGDAVKTVYIRFKDNSGNVSSIYSDTITLDTVAPTVTAHPIVNNDINVVRSRTTLTYTFSEAMNSATINTATAKVVTKAGSPIVTAVLTKPDSTHVTFTLNSPGFYFGRNYAIDLLTGITDLAGNALAPERVDFTIENDIFENTGPTWDSTGNGYPNNAFFLWTTEVDTPHMISGQLYSQDYDGYLARTQSIGGFSDQDRYSLYIDCAQSNSITIHVFTTDAFGNPTTSLAVGQGIKFVLYNPVSSPVLSSSNVLQNSKNGTWTIPYGTESDYYTLVIYGDDSGRYYDFTWSEDYNGM